MTNCSFATIRERDMDLLFLEAIVSDPDFGALVLSHTKYKEKNFSVIDAVLSRTELELGESDITIVMEIDGVRVALLIEDKIDAIAMPNQYERYRLRGEKGVENNEWREFEIFIFCPEKYRTLNDEAKKYNHFLSYETCKAYFDGKQDVISNIRSQQFEQAIRRAKKPPAVNIDQNANAFLINYLEYQQEYYPSLDIRTSKDSSGWWIHFGTQLGNVYLYHKTQEGYVDLTFPNASEDLGILQSVAVWLRKHGTSNVNAKKTGKAAALRIEVPKLKVKEPFEMTSKADLKACFDAIQTLVDFANIVESMHCVSAIKSKKLH